MPWIAVMKTVPSLIILYIDREAIFPNISKAINARKL